MTWLFQLSTVAALAGSLQAGSIASVPRTSEGVVSGEWSDWLEDVDELLHEKERALFLRLPSDDEKAVFVEAFWQRRAAHFGASARDVRDAHYRRLDEVTRKFGRRSARAEVTLAIGDPSRVERVFGHGDVVDAEIWLYDRPIGRRFPSRVALVFFREAGIGELTLYSPTDDGPNALLRADARIDIGEAVARLAFVSRELAAASVSIDPEHPSGRLAASGRVPVTIAPAPESGELLVRIRDFERSRVDVSYVEAYEDLARAVGAAESFRYYASRRIATVLHSPNGTAALHYSLVLSPDSLLWLEREGQGPVATLDVSLTIRDRSGRRVLRREKAHRLEPPATLPDGILQRPVAIQDRVPLLPGSYLARWRVEDEATGRFTTLDRPVTVADGSDRAPTIAAVVLGSSRYDVSPSERGRAPFSVGAVRVDPATVFAPGERMHVLVQTLHVENGAGARIRLDHSDGPALLQPITVEASSDGAVTSVELPELDPGSYNFIVELTDESGRVVTSRGKAFDVVAPDALERPGLTFRVSAEVGTAADDVALGEQAFALSRFEEAQVYFRRALSLDGGTLTKARLGLGRSLLFRGRAEDALEALAPLSGSLGEDADVAEALGIGYYMTGSFEKAAPLLEHARGSRDPDVSLLNALGSVYMELGELDRARNAYRDSIELDDDQPVVRAWLDGTFGREPPDRAPEPFRVLTRSSPKGEPAAVELVHRAAERFREELKRRGDWFVSVTDEDDSEIVVDFRAAMHEPERARGLFVFADVRMFGESFGLRGEDHRRRARLANAVSDLAFELQNISKKSYWLFASQR